MTKHSFHFIGAPFHMLMMLSAAAVPAASQHHFQCGINRIEFVGCSDFPRFRHFQR